MAELLVWDKTRERAATYWRVKIASAIVSKLTGWRPDDSVAQSARFESAWREDKTSLAGLLEGHIFDRIAGSADCSGERNEGPPGLH
jgi:hypothetical protein